MQFANFQVTPAKFLRTAFGIRGLSSAYISRVFLRTEMALKSKSVLTGSRSLARSRSTDNLPTSQSQVNIQMMSHTLTIREVRLSNSLLSIQFCIYFDLLTATCQLSAYPYLESFISCRKTYLQTQLIILIDRKFLQVQT